MPVQRVRAQEADAGGDYERGGHYPERCAQRVASPRRKQREVHLGSWWRLRAAAAWSLNILRPNADQTSRLASLRLHDGVYAIEQVQRLICHQRYLVARLASRNWAPITIVLR